MILQHYYEDDYVNHILLYSRSKLLRFNYEEYYLNFYLINIEKNIYSINSSPFFGSHGGIYISKSSKNLNNTKHQTICCSENFDKVFKFMSKISILSLNIVSNPFATLKEKQINESFIKSIDKQNIFLKNIISRSGFIKNVCNGDTEESILNSYHSKTRNCIRKFLNSKKKVEFIKPTQKSLWKKYIKEIAENHEISIKLKNGVSKSIDYFVNLDEHFNSERVFIVRISDDTESNNLLASCLFFKIENTVEYWTPVINEKGKAVNALQGLIYFLNIYMKENNLKYLNFGGTWPNQQDLYRFKSRFGSIEFKYNYYNYVNNNLKKKFNLSSLMKKNPFFYFWEKEK